MLPLLITCAAALPKARKQSQTLFQATLAFRRAGTATARAGLEASDQCRTDGINSGGHYVPWTFWKNRWPAAGPASEVPIEAPAYFGGELATGAALRGLAAWVSEAVQRLEAGSQPILPSTIPLVVGDRLSRGVCGASASISRAAAPRTWESHSPLALDSLARDPAAHGDASACG